MLYNHSRKSGQHTHSDNSIIVCQLLIRISISRFRKFVYQISVFKSYLLKLCQHCPRYRPCLCRLLRPVISLRHHDLSPCSCGLLLSCRINMLANQHSSSHLLRISHTVCQRKSCVRAPGQVHPYTCVFLQLFFRISELY